MYTLYRYARIFILPVLLLAGMASCKKSFLEVKPKGKVIAERTYHYDQMLNHLDLINMGTGMGQVLLGDEIAAIEPRWTASTTYRERQLFKFEPDMYMADENAIETTTPVKSLYIYNKVLNEVMESTEGSEAQKKSIRGEALVGRAWVNFLFVNYYGKPYDPATAATDIAFPLITKADINQTDFPRATVQQMYDLIISDLTAAIPDITSIGVTHPARMSQVAARGLLAKVYVFMGKYAEALPLLNQAIENVALSTFGTTLLDYNTSFPGFPNANIDMENIISKYTFNSWVGSTASTFYLTPAATALYGATDVRFTKWFDTKTYPNGVKIIKRKGSYSSYLGLRVPELYLLRAEVKARLNDLPGAVADLEYFRKRRMPVAAATVPPAAAAAKLPLLQFIMEERIREFAMWGYRWFDMRRLSVDPLFTTPVYKHDVYAETGEIKESFTLDAPKRFVLRIPPKILAENPGMPDNP